MMWSPTLAGCNIPMSRRCYLSNWTVFSGRKFIAELHYLNSKTCSLRAGFQRQMSSAYSSSRMEILQPHVQMVKHRHRCINFHTYIHLESLQAHSCCLFIDSVYAEIGCVELYVPSDNTLSYRIFTRSISKHK